MKLSYDELRQLLVDFVHELHSESLISCDVESLEYGGWDSPAEMVEERVDLFLDEKESELELPLED